VEVDDAAGLDFGDFGVPDSDAGGQGGAELVADEAAESGDGAVP
jgi:hypothetical protein